MPKHPAPPFRCRSAGLLIESEIPLNLRAADNDATPPDAWVRLAAVPERLPAPLHSGRAWDMEPGRFLVRRDEPPLRILVRDGREILVDGEAREPDVPAIIIATGLGLLLQQRGVLLLHGSSVAVGGRAVAFIGDSGAGKSTLAAALTQFGHPLLSEDQCAVAFDAAGRPQAQSDGRRMKLSLAAAAELGLPAVAPALEGEVYVDVPTVTGPLPLAAVYCVETGGEPALFPYDRIESIARLRRRGVRHEVIGMEGREKEHFLQASRVASVAGVYELMRPDDFRRLPDVLDLVRRHWEAEGWV